MSSATYIVLAFAILFVSSTLGHSQMRCAKYDLATGACHAPIRNSAESFGKEANDFASGEGFCQSPMTNPISAAYANGAGCPSWAPCPAPMGTFKQGENFTIMWLARNHAVADQTPGTVSLYMSPVESPNAGKDVSASVMQSNLICKGPFMNCNGQNGDFVQCYLNCKMPATTDVGIHTFWWKWVWDNHFSVYTTCADINVVAGSSSGSAPTPAPLPAPTPAPVPVPTPTPVPASTTGRASTSTSTSGRPASTSTSTSGKVSTSTSTSTSGKVSTSTSTSSSSTTCTVGHMKCLTSETYSTCAHNLWGVSQSCGQGTVCKPSGNYIYCVRP